MCFPEIIFETHFNYKLKHINTYKKQMTLTISLFNIILKGIEHKKHYSSKVGKNEKN